MRFSGVLRTMTCCALLAGSLALSRSLRPQVHFGIYADIDGDVVSIPRSSAKERVRIWLRYNLDGALESGCFHVPPELSALGRKLDIMGAPNAEKMQELTARAGDSTIVDMPASWKGATTLTFALETRLPAAWKGIDAKLPTIDIEEKPAPAPAVSFHAADPWANLNAAGFQKVVAPVRSMKMLALKNEFVTSALILRASRPAGVSLKLEVPEALKGRLTMRVMGSIVDSWAKTTVYDPVFMPEQAHSEATMHAVNGTRIAFFPDVVADDKDIVFLWFTFNATDLAPVQTTATLKASYGGKVIGELPIRLEVSPVTLPKRNPLKTFMWQWSKDDPENVRKMVEHGINVFWRNHRAAWKNGAEFLLFQFQTTFSRPELTDKVKAAIIKEMDELIALTRELHVPADCWAVNLADEVGDSRIDKDLKVIRFIRSRYPGVQLYFNPGFGYTADKHQPWTTMKTFKGLDNFPDIIQPYSWHLWKTEGVKEHIRKHGADFWVYDINAIASRTPGAPMGMLRKESFLAFLNGCTGIGNFALNAWYRGLPWKNDDPKNENHALMYDADGLVVSRTYEAFRQGLMEYKRLWLLKKFGWKPKKLMAYAQKMYEAKTPDELRKLVGELDKVLLKIYQDASGEIAK